MGKLTHSGKFRLTIGALELLSRYAKHKVRRLQAFSYGTAAKGLKLVCWNIAQYVCGSVCGWSDREDGGMTC